MEGSLLMLLMFHGCGLLEFLYFTAAVVFSVTVFNFL